MDIALFVRARKLGKITLTHECERSSGTDIVALQFIQPLIEAFYTLHDDLFVFCQGIPSVPCQGPPRLLRLSTGGLADILREFRITAVPVAAINAAYSALAEEGIPAQEAIDRAEREVSARMASQRLR